MADAPPPGTGMPDRNRGPQILAICGSLTAIAFVFVAVRFFVRISMTRNVGWDDCFVLLSWISFSTNSTPLLKIELLLRYRIPKIMLLQLKCVCLPPKLIVSTEMMIFIPEVANGAGRHVAYIKPPANVTYGLKLNFITQPLCLLAVNLVRISIGLFLLGLTPSVLFSRIIKGTIVFTTLACLSHISKSPEPKDCDIWNPISDRYSCGLSPMPTNSIQLGGRHRKVYAGIVSSICVFFNSGKPHNFTNT